MLSYQSSSGKYLLCCFFAHILVYKTDTHYFLYSASGSETYIRDVEKFVDLEDNDTWSFWDVALKARQRQEVAVGYKPVDMDYQTAEELIVNPPNKAIPRKWSKGDKIITFSLED